MKTAAKGSASTHPQGTAALQAGQTVMPVPRPTEHEIRARAYAIYQQRGRASGHALDDWLQAERGLRAR